MDADEVRSRVDQLAESTRGPAARLRRARRTGRAFPPDVTAARDGSSTVGLVSEVPHPGGGLAVGGRTDQTVD
jgi:hypothetical protein